MATRTELPSPDESEVTELPERGYGAPDWGRTVDAMNRAKYDAIYYEDPDSESPHGYFEGRPIIGSDTRINGGVYLGGSEREAIVVDDTDSEITQKVYEQLLERLTMDGEFDKEQTIAAVYDVVEENLPYDYDGVNAITAGLPPDQKINLEVFIARKAGVCRHQALLAGYLLERLKDDNFIRGTVSVRRNSIAGVGAHGWAEYTAYSGVKFVIDPAQQYHGLKSDAEMRGDRWRY